MPDLIMNGVECDDCPGWGNYYETGELEFPECPIDSQHESVFAVHMSRTPLGRDDDADCKVGGRDLWVYQVD